MEPCKKLDVSQMVTEIRRRKAHRVLGASKRLHWGWHHSGTLCFGDVCLCEWLKPLSFLSRGATGAACTGRLLSRRDLGGVTTERFFPKHSRGSFA